MNFRDLGGLRTEDGRHVRRGVLYRSGAPTTESDRRRVADASIALVCDLRSPVERRAESLRWADGHSPAVIAIELMSDEEAAGTCVARNLLADATGQTAREYMLTTYRQMPERFATGGLDDLVTRLLAPGGLPVLIHCHAGKDRTGVASAILLIALGVPRAAVVADYMLSDDEVGIDIIFETVRGRADEVLDFTPSLSALEPMRVNVEYLEAALAEIERKWGSVVAFLAGPGRVTAEQLAMLQNTLLEEDLAEHPVSDG